MMDDLDEDEGHRWSQDLTQEMNCKGRMLGRDLKGSDGLMDIPFYPHRQSRCSRRVLHLLSN